MIHHYARRRLLGIFLSLAALGWSATNASAQFVWNNPAGGTWSVGENWVGGAAPAPGLTTVLVFGAPGTAASSYIATNDIGTTPFDLNALTFNGDAGTLVTINALDNLVNGLNFVGEAPTVTIGAGNATIAPPVQFNSSAILGGGGGTLTFANEINSVVTPVVGVTLTKNSTGSLVLGGGGIFDTLSVQAGSASATGGTLFLIAPTGTGNNASGLQLGAAAGQTVDFTASGGAVVTVTENIYVGDVVGTTGNIVVRGAGTVLSNTGGESGRFGVGNFGTGSLMITEGGVVNAERLFSSRQAGSSSSVIIDGAGSTLHATFQASFGSFALGTVIVRNGGSIVADRIFNLGNNPAGNGVLTVTGEGSSVTAFNPAIGALGTGTMTVADGATAEFTTHVPPGGANIGLSIASGANSTGTLDIRTGGAVTVVGDSSTGDEGQLVIGEANNANGTLIIQSGGSLDLTGTVFAGAVANSTGTATVTGADSTLTVGNMIFGGGSATGGRGDLNVTAGGRVSAENATFAQDPQSSSTIVVDAGTLAIADQFVLALESSGNLTIRNGGAMTVGGNAFVSIVPGVTGNITVTGSGSSLAVTDQFQLGGAGPDTGGTATLTVSNGATASAGDLLILFSGGSLNIDGGTVNAGGVFDADLGTNTGPIVIGTGGTLNVLGAVDAGHTGVISGAGSINKSGTALQLLGGDNSYSGGTTVSGGTVLVSHPRALGTGPVTINATGDVTLDPDLTQAARFSSLNMAGGANPTGTMDVTDGKLIITNGDLGTVSNGTFTGIARLLQSGYNAGAWDGKGIMTSETEPAGRSIGVARAQDIGLAGGEFGGVPVAAGDVLVAFTLAGDADLDGTVDFDDLARLAQSYNTTDKFWFQGDFTYDGDVDFDDLALMAQNYNQSLPTAAAIAAIASAAPSFQADLARAFAQVPEPAALALTALAAAVLLPRRRPSRQEQHPK